jgi:hypothetical protein
MHGQATGVATGPNLADPKTGTETGSRTAKTAKKRKNPKTRKPDLARIKTQNKISISFYIGEKFVQTRKMVGSGLRVGQGQKVELGLGEKTLGWGWRRWRPEGWWQ